MATSLSPFIFPTTAPAYAPTTLFPPPPFGFEAPAYGHHIFPSAATYPPPLSTGGYSTFPFPFFYNAPPAFSYAATYPYPPPASAYTPASGFSPNWPTWPPPSPDPTPSTAAPTAPDREDRPPQRQASTPAVDSARSSHSSPAGMPATLLRHPDQVPGAPLAIDLTKGNSAGGETISDEKFVRKHTGPGIFPMSNAGTDHGFVTHQALQGELSKLSNLVSQFAVAMGMQTTEAPLSTGSSLAAASTQFRSPAIFPASSSSSPCDASFAAFTTTFASVSATSPSDVRSATNSVAPQVFGEKPTPRYLHGTQATTLNCCDGHQNLMRGPSVQGGGTNLREQYVDEVPKSYGFNNLSRQSLFLADGTERRYFALPEDYPLEQVTPPMSYSAVEKVGVPSVAAQTAALAPVLCFTANNTAGSELLVPNLQQPLNVQDASRVFMETPVYDIYEEEDSFCLNIISDVPDFTLALQQQDDERAFNCSVLMASDSFLTRCSQLSIEHSRRELRLLWDPGASASLHSSKAEPHRELSYVPIVFPKVLTLCNQVRTYVQKLRDSRWNVLVSHERRKEWDPGDTELHVLFMVAAGATKLQCTDVCKSLMLQILAVQFDARAPIFESAIMRSYAFGLGWTEVNASALFVLALSSAHTHFNFLSCNSPLSLGNFAISDLWCNTTLAGDKIFGGLNTAANSQNVLPCISISDTEHICLFVKLSPWTILSAQHFLDSTMKNSRIFSTERTLPCNPRYAILLLHHFLWEFSIRPATRLKWDPGVKVSLDCWLDVLTAWSENDNPLSCTRIPGLAALQTQSVGITTSYVWNPGSMLLQYKSLTEEKENVTLILEQWSFLFRALHCCQIFQRCTAMSSLLYWHQHIKFNGIALWLISLKLLNNGESF